jgi:hypothetical protein
MPAEHAGPVGGIDGRRGQPSPAATRRPSGGQTACDGDARVVDIIGSFFAWSKLDRSAETCRNHVWYGQAFAEHIGHLKATERRPNHLTQWVDCPYRCRGGSSCPGGASRRLYRDEHGVCLSGEVGVRRKRVVECRGGAVMQAMVRLKMNPLRPGRLEPRVYMTRPRAQPKLQLRASHASHCLTSLLCGIGAAPAASPESVL